MMELKWSMVIVIILFGIGVVTYGAALYLESITGEPFYVVLSTLAALLTVSATFGAIIIDWLNK